MKNALVFILFILLGHLSFGQESTKYIPFKKGNKWSVADENGKLLFKPKFQETYPAIHNRIRFKQDGKYGFINPSGEIVIKPIYLDATDFNSSGRKTLSYVTTPDSSFSIDLDGTAIIPTLGCGGVISNWANGFHVFNSNGKSGVIAIGRDTIIQPVFKYIKNYNDGYFVFAQNFDQKFGVLDHRGDTIYGFSLDSISYDWTYTRARIYKIYEKGKVGVIGISGIVEAQPKYDEIKPYLIENLLCFMAFRKGKILGYIYNQKEFWK